MDTTKSTQSYEVMAAQELQSILNKLYEAPNGLKFHQSGSRHIEARRLREGITVFGEPIVEVTTSNDLEEEDPFKSSSLLSLLKTSKPSTKQGFVDDDTDYDFFCLHSPDHVKYLEALGFYSCEPDETYCDDLCKDVFKHPDQPVEVVLRTDPDLYKIVLDNIPIPVYYTHLWKSSPEAPDRNAIRELFNTMFAIAKAVKDSK